MRQTVILVLSLLVAPSLWGYSVQVNKVTDFAQSFTRLAMLPASCPTGVDCIWIESLVAGKLSDRGLKIVAAPIVRQLMFDLEMKAVTPESRKILADKLGVDAFVVTAVDSMATENAGTTGVFIGNIFTAVPSRRTSGSVQLAIVSADTGKTLMEGTGFGESTARPKRGVIGKAFNQIIDRAFPPAFFAARDKK
jgi:hypothetical protein